MSSNNLTGSKAEQLASDYLLVLGHTILHRNFRHSRYEIDLITEKDGIIHFVEIKARTKREIVPEVNVTVKKFRSFQKAARAFLHKYPKYTQVQFDVLAVTIGNSETPEFLLIEDVYL
jgi:putative endonuclease